MLNLKERGINMRLKNKFKIACLFSLTTLLSSNIAFAEPTKDQKMMMNENFTMMDWFLYRNELDLINDGANKFIIETDRIYLHVGVSDYNSFTVGLDHDRGKFYISNYQLLRRTFPKIDGSKLTLDDGKKVCTLALKAMAETYPALKGYHSYHLGFSSSSYKPYTDPEVSLIDPILRYTLKIERDGDSKLVNCEIPNASNKGFDEITFSFEGKW